MLFCQISEKFATNYQNIFLVADIFKCATFLHKYIIICKWGGGGKQNSWFFTSKDQLFALDCIEFSEKYHFLSAVRNYHGHYKKNC